MQKFHTAGGFTPERGGPLGEVMANGHGEESWIDALREWMPSIIAAIGVVGAWMWWAARWVVNDRRFHIDRLNALYLGYKELKDKLEKLNAKESYPDRATSEEVHEVYVLAEKLDTEFEITKKRARIQDKKST